MTEQEQDSPVQEVEEDEDNPNYKLPAPKALDEIVNADAEDESLRKYKETLLGQCTKEVVVINKDNPNNVIIDKMALIIRDRDEPMELDLKKSPEELKSSVFTIKEGCFYRIAITFHVQREIVTGLQYKHKVYKKSIKVGSFHQMMGSYAPNYDAHTFKTNEEEAPKGMLLRGDYKIKAEFVDDDDDENISWEFNLAVKKDW